MAEGVVAVQEEVEEEEEDMTADPRQAHTTMRAMTAVMIQGKTTEWALDRLHQQTMAMDRHHRAIMEDLNLRSSQDPRQRQRRPRQEMEMIARPYGDCLALWTKTVCHVCRRSN